jgi:hypothetical protein
VPATPSFRVAALGDELVLIHDTPRQDLHQLHANDTPPGRPLGAHCLAFCAALSRHHTGEESGAFPVLAVQFPGLRPLLDKMAEDHRLIADTIARVEKIARQVAGGSSPQLITELVGLGAIMESHFSFGERRIRDALDALDGTAADLMGA